jgi:hypothetical protein
VFLESLLPALGFVVLLRTDRGDFRLLSTAPHWFADAAKTAAGDDLATLGGTLPFLEHVSAEADKFWWSGRVGTATGEVFALPGSSGDYLVRPRFAMVDGHKLLLLEQLTGEADNRAILQTAREAQLAHEQTRVRLGDVRAPIDTIADLASRLIAQDLPTGARESVTELLRAAETARAALDAL